jgi:hypothetical protein
MKAKLSVQSEARRNIGAGAGIGVVLGAALADLLVDSSLVGILGMFLGAAIGAAIGSRYSPSIHLMEYPKGVTRRLVISGAFFSVVLLVALRLSRDDLDRSYQIALAIAPLIPGLILVASIGDAISKLDELQRKIQIEAIAIGYGITILVTMTFGLLAQAGLQQLNWLYVTLTMLLAWLVGKLWIGWKYR